MPVIFRPECRRSKPASDPRACGCGGVMRAAAVRETAPARMHPRANAKAGAAQRQESIYAAWYFSKADSFTSMPRPGAKWKLQEPVLRRLRRAEAAETIAARMARSSGGIGQRDMLDEEIRHAGGKMKRRRGSYGSAIVVRRDRDVVGLGQRCDAPGACDSAHARCPAAQHLPDHPATMPEMRLDLRCRARILKASPSRPRSCAPLRD